MSRADFYFPTAEMARTPPLAQASAVELRDWQPIAMPKAVDIQHDRRYIKSDATGNPR
jgi:hypothetical protein